jgi:two-component system LytT family response regulator
MANIKAIIVDEERLSRVNLRRLLEPFPEIEIAGEATSCAGALELVSLYNPQLIFLDIQLHGETGIDLLEFIDNSTKIIFVTAYEEYSISGYIANTIDYLLKPVNPERLREAIEITKRQLKQTENRNKELLYSESYSCRHLKNITVSLNISSLD